jgi:hypothetical protein
MVDPRDYRLQMKRLVQRCGNAVKIDLKCDVAAANIFTKLPSL